MSALVLIADGDPKRLERVRRLVEGEGAEIVTAPDACEAMSLFVRRRPDVTLLQVDPKEDLGMELCRDMKTLDAGRLSSVVVVARRAERSAAFEAGCDAFVGRPSKDESLLHAVRRFLLLRRRPQRTAATDVSP